MTPTSWTQSVQLGEYDFPMKLIRESRRSIRVAIAKHEVILRAPVYSSHSDSSLVGFATEWLAKLKDEAHPSIERFKAIDPNHQLSFSVLGGPLYQVNVMKSEDCPENKSTLVREGFQLKITISNKLNAVDSKRMISSIISKYIAKRYATMVERRIDYWNDLHFRMDIGRICLKNNASNWGSCSSKRNINIATRTLLLPLELADYVFVHELAHLIELNHSSRFWSLVGAVMPNYLEKEARIKEIRSQLIF